ncbi:transporter [Streptomyces sp. NPDC002055]|uniref:transporter n=1 Tax=Streptomyces sp. NPDC002055 TaxID=3154534 RepID=UPI003333AE80
MARRRPVSAGTAPAAPVAPALTPVFVRLKLSLLRNGLRQSSGRRVAYVASVVVTLLFAALQLIGLIALRGNAHAAALTVVVVALLALGWAAMPLWFPGGDETLDPTRLVMLPLRPRPLVRALLVSSLIGIGPLFTLTLVVGSVIAVADGAAAVAAGVPAAALVMLVCVALSRAVAAANIRLLTSRKGRDLALLSGLFIAIGLQFVNLGAQKLAEPDGLKVLEPASEVLRWLPPASALDAVRAAGEGAYVQCLAQLLANAVVLVLLLRWWQRSLVHLMTAPDGSTLQAVTQEQQKEGRSAGLAGLLPAGRTGTVMLRTLRYSWRDPRSRASWATSLGVGLLLPFVSALQGNTSVYTACWAAGLLGLQMGNQFGQDTSAFWMVAQTIASRRDALLELRGRAMALGAVGVPFVLLVTVGTAAYAGQWDALPEVLGLSLTLLGSLVGTGALASAVFPYSIPQDSGHKSAAPGQTGLAWISFGVSLLAGLIVSAPVLGLTIWLHLAGAHAWLWLVLPLGAAYGLALVALGLRIAAPRVSGRLPEILTAVSKG